MKLLYNGSILASWLTVLLTPPLLYYRDRKAQRQKQLQPTFFFDQMQFLKNAVDDNPKYHIISDVSSSIKNKLFCRLIPISTTHTIFGEITIENNRIVNIKAGGNPEDSLLLSVYEYGYLLEGRDSLGRRIMTLGTFEQGEEMPQITKDIVGRSLVVENQDREILAAGIIAKV